MDKNTSLRQGRNQNLREPARQQSAISEFTDRALPINIRYLSITSRMGGRCGMSHTYADRELLSKFCSTTEADHPQQSSSQQRQRRGWFGHVNQLSDVVFTKVNHKNRVVEVAV